MVTKVKDVMTRDVVAVDPSTSVVEAAKLMIEQEKGPLPVMEGERPVGMITDRDVIARVVAPGRDPRSLTVADVSTKGLVTVRPDQDLDEARGLLARHELDRLVVVEGNRLAGILSEADIRADEGPLATAVTSRYGRRAVRGGRSRASTTARLPFSVARLALVTLGVQKAGELLGARRSKRSRADRMRRAATRGAWALGAAGTATGVAYLGASGRLQGAMDRMRGGSASSPPQTGTMTPSAGPRHTPTATGQTPPPPEPGPT